MYGLLDVRVNIVKSESKAAEAGAVLGAATLGFMTLGQS